MSPLALRRYRAERLLRREFDALRPRVLRAVRGRLRARGLHMDTIDLEACYAQAWQGLYATVLGGQQVHDPLAWLVLVSFRRALEERPLRDGASPAPGRGTPAATGEPDVAARLDDLARLRQVFEALKGRLSARERQAASLCYLQGLSRAEAAARMGISERRMRKLMDGVAADGPGVAGKVGELLGVIRAGQWCDEQGSLMRALAFGLLHPDGERYRLAVAHVRQCPACRAYVGSLRGLAAALPPVALPVGLGAGSAAAAGAGGAAASGGWLVAGGSLTAKLAAGCLLALGVGAGCLALGPRLCPVSGCSAPPAHAKPDRSRSHREARSARSPTAAVTATEAAFTRSAASSAGRSAPRRSKPAAVGGETHARREFGPEQSGGNSASAGPSSPMTAAPRVVRAQAASVAPAPQPTPTRRAQREFGFE